MEKVVHVFTDEFGDPNLDTVKEGVTKLYIIAAVIVDDEDLELANQRASEVFKKKTKSSAIGKNHKKRINLLKRINPIPFKYIATIVNKKQINPASGLRFNPSFYKFFNQKLFKHLLNTEKKHLIKADRFKGKRFWNEFQEYAGKRFDNFKHDFVRSDSEALVRLADFIAGTLSYYFDSDRENRHSDEFRALLKEHEILVECWPTQSPLSTPIQQEIDLDQVEKEFGSTIRKKNLQRAETVLDELNHSPDSKLQNQHDALKILILNSKFAPNNYWLNRNDICGILGIKALASEAFQSQIIKPIRDKGVILAGTHSGYRLAVSIKDISADMRDDASKIEPSLRRITRTTDGISLLFNHEVNIFELTDTLALKTLVEAYKAQVEKAAKTQM